MLQIIGGTFKKKKLKSPKGLSTRPTSSRLREAVFNICQQEVVGSRFLDLFSGSGAMGIEALSRGADLAVFVDKDKLAVDCIRSNLKTLSLEKQARVVMGDAAAFLSQFGTYDIIYVDPPYTEKGAEICYSHQILFAIDQSQLLAAGGMLFIEEGSVWKPEVEALKSLHLKNSRKVGRSMLHQFLWKAK